MEPRAPAHYELPHPRDLARRLALFAVAMLGIAYCCRGCAALAPPPISVAAAVADCLVWANVETRASILGDGVAACGRFTMVSPSDDPSGQSCSYLMRIWSSGGSLDHLHVAARAALLPSLDPPFVTALRETEVETSARPMLFERSVPCDAVAGAVVTMTPTATKTPRPPTPTADIPHFIAPRPYP